MTFNGADEEEEGEEEMWGVGVTESWQKFKSASNSEEEKTQNILEDVLCVKSNTPCRDTYAPSP